MSAEPNDFDYFSADVGHESTSGELPNVSADPVARSGKSSDTQAKGADKGKASWMSGKTVLYVIMGLIGALTVVWIVMPAGNSSAPKHYASAEPAAPSPEMQASTPGVSGVAPSNQSALLGAVTAPAPASSIVAVAPLALAAAPDSSPAPAVALSQVTALNDRVGALEAQVSGMDSKVDALVKASQHNVATAPAAPSALTPKTRAPAHETGRRTATAMPAHRVVKPSVAKTATPVRSLEGVPYSINTIAPGIAWIEAGEHIEIVQPGDRIGLQRVLAIDPVSRRVITTDGIIH
jgi:hypothetical protein